MEMINIENFDCTQFITFNLKNQNNKNILISLNKMFKKIGFNCLPISNIKDVKKKYFKNDLFDYFFELDNDLFLAEFDCWEIKENPPELIKQFVKTILDFKNCFSIKQFRIIISEFAQEDVTEKTYLIIKEKDFIDTLFIMSAYYFGENEPQHNLILDILD